MAQIEILSHRTARPEVSQQMRELATSLQDRAVLHENVTFPLPPVSKDTEIVVVNAGDGIKGAAAQTYAEQLLLVVPGGSKNAIDDLLLRENTKVSIAQLKDDALGEIPLYHPLELNGEKALIFIGLDDIARTFFRQNEALRARFAGRMRSARHTIAQVRSFVEAVRHNPMNPGIQLFTIDPQMDQLPDFPNQHVYGAGRNVSKLMIDGKTKAERVGKVALLFVTAPVFTKMGLRPPSWLAAMDTQSSFTILDPRKEHTTGLFDGEEGSFPNNGVIFVARSDTRDARRIAALVE